MQDITKGYQAEQTNRFLIETFLKLNPALNNQLQDMKNNFHKNTKDRSIHDYGWH